MEKKIFPAVCGRCGDRRFHVALPVAAFFEMLSKPVTSRATTATRAGCIQRRLGRNTLTKARQ